MPNIDSKVFSPNIIIYHTIRPIKHGEKEAILREEDCG